MVFCILFFSGCKITKIKYAKVVNVQSALNMREGPDTESEIVSKINKNEEVEIWSENQNGWIKIKYEGKEGYANANYLQVESSDSSNSIIPQFISNTWQSLKSLQIWTDIQKSTAWNWVHDLWDSLQDSWVGSVFKVIGYILGVILLILIIRLIFFVIGFLLSILLTGIGGALIVGIAGFLVSGFDFSTGGVCMKWGFWIGIALGSIYAIFNPVKAVSEAFDFPSYSSVSSSSESNSPSINSKVDVYTNGGGDKYYVDENGQTHWLREESNGYSEVGGDGEYYDENGFRVH